MSKDVNIGVETVKGSAGKVGQAILGFAGTIIFARVLGPVSFGGFYLLLTLVRFADRPIQGLAMAVNKRYSEHDANEEEIFGGMLIVGTVFIVIVFISTYFFRDRLFEVTTVDGAWLVFTSILAATVYFQTVQKMLAGEGWIGKQTWNDTLRSVFTLGLQLGLVYIGLGAAGMGYGLAGATFLVVPVALYFLRVRPTLPSRRTFSSLWKFAKFSMPSSLIRQSQGRFDVIIIGAFIGTGAVGQYEVADRLTVPALFLAGIATTGLLTKVSNYHSQGRDFDADVQNVIAYASLFAVPIFFGSLAIADKIVVTVYGIDYRSAAPLLVGLALTQIFATQTNVYRATINGIDMPYTGLRIDTVALVINVGLGLVLVFPYGAIGIVIATAVTSFITYVLSIRAVELQAGPVKKVPRPFQMQIISGVLMWIIVESLSQSVLPVRSWYDLLLLVGAGGIVYFTVLTITCSHFRFTAKSLIGEFVDSISVG